MGNYTVLHCHLDISNWVFIMRVILKWSKGERTKNSEN